MEFLNGLRAQPLELLVGEVCQQAGGLITHCTSCCCQSVFFSPLLAESKLLRQEAQDTGLWQYVSYSFVYVDFRGVCGVFQKGGFCQDVVLCR